MKQRPRTLYRKLVAPGACRAAAGLHDEPHGGPHEGPAEIRIRINGVLAHGHSVHDLLDHVLGRIGPHGLRRSAVEFCGNAVARLSVGARLRLCEAVIAQGAVAAVIGADRTLPEAMLVVRPGTGAGAGAAERRECAAASRTWRSDFCAPFERDVVVDARDAAVARR